MIDAEKVLVMTREEFEKGYAMKSGTSVKWLHDLGQVAVPCDCGEDGCDGWAMVRKGGPLDPDVWKFPPNNKELSAETTLTRNYLYFDTGSGKSVSWLGRILIRLGFRKPPLEGIPDDAVITKASLIIYTNEEGDND